MDINIPLIQYKWVQILIVVLLLAGYGSISQESPIFKGYDLHQYVKMAEAYPGFDFENISAPARYRIIGPWLAAAFPGSIEVGFRVLTWLSLFMIVIFLIKIAQEYLKSNTALMLMVFMLLINPYLIGFITWDYFQSTDTLGLACLLGAIFYGGQKKYFTFCFFMMIGVGTREIVWLAVPVVMIYQIRKGLHKDWWKIISAISPALMIYLSLRYFFPQGAFELGGEVRWNISKITFLQTYFRLFINAWIPILALLIIKYKDVFQLLKSKPELMVWIAVGFIFSFLGGDQERLLLPIAPAVYLIFYFILSQNQTKPIMIILFICGVLGYFHHQIGLINLPTRNVTIGLRIISFTMAFLFLGYYFFNSASDLKTDSEK